MITKMNSRLLKRMLVFTCVLTFLSTQDLPAQDKRVIRMARIKIDSAELKNYKVAVKEQIEAAVREEPGVLMLYAVQDKKDATSVTVFEIYANQEAYQAHLLTPHFKKYKSSTLHMIKSLELIDVDPIAMEAKKKR